MKIRETVQVIPATQAGSGVNSLGGPKEQPDSPSDNAIRPFSLQGAKQLVRSRSYRSGGAAGKNTLQTTFRLLRLRLQESGTAPSDTDFQTYAGCAGRVGKYACKPARDGALLAAVCAGRLGGTSSARLCTVP
jgi:hypothetical protein